jgi:prepilin-type N-terminal cleavage/methylation domain-containing protein
MTRAHKISKQISQSGNAAGFSLIELMVAMGVFLVVGAAAVSLVRQHMPLFNTSQNQATLNVTLRNAVAQMQMEVVNAGTGFAGATATGFSPMGVTISKATTPGCNTASTPAVYTSTCFDRFSLIAVDGSLPLLAPAGNSALTSNADTSQTTLFLTSPTGATAAQYTAWAALLPAGTELMFVQGGTGVPAISIVTVQAAAPSANYIQLTTQNATVTLNNCKTDTGASVTVSGVPQVEDPLNLYDVGECERFTGVFNPALDYVVKLIAGATYQVDTSTAGNPKLVRITSNGTSDTIAEQIIGFTVGAWSSQKVVGGVVTPGYTTNPADFSSDWSSVRSLQIQIVARATPGTDTSSNSFQNAYDQGNYQVQGMAVVINPRNLNTN